MEDTKNCSNVENITTFTKDVKSVPNKIEPAVSVKSTNDFKSVPNKKEAVAATANPLKSDFESVEFCCVLFCGLETECFVVGEVPQIGEWDVSKGVKMERISPTTIKKGYEIVPTLFRKVVELRRDALTSKDGVQFKFVRKADHKISWEEGISTETGNRSIKFNEEKQSMASNDHLRPDIVLGSYHRTTTNGALSMCPAHFSVSESITEHRQTTAYYRCVQANNDMDYNIIDDEIILGSSPRTLEHLLHLKSIGVTTIVNLQTEDDVLENGPLHDLENDNTITNYRKAVKDANLHLIWAPTTDMCTEGRAGMVAHVSWMMYGALRNKTVQKQKAYVHCNAGVGRSTAAVMGFYCYIKNYTPEQCYRLLSSRRPVIFFDKEAITRGGDDFKSIYGQLK